MIKIYYIIDAFLIAPFRYPESALLGWWMGSIFLSFWCAVAGKLTFMMVAHANKGELNRSHMNMIKYHTQSVNALKAGDTASYKAINHLANEAFGKSYFIRFALSASALWPVALSLAWLQTRFQDVVFELPLSIPMAGNKVGYPFLFIPTYIAMHMLIARFFNLRK